MNFKLLRYQNVQFRLERSLEPLKAFLFEKVIIVQAVRCYRYNPFPFKLI